MKTLIPPTTAAATSDPIYIGNEPKWTLPAVPVTIYLNGIPGSDTIALQYLDGTTWRALVSGGVAITLSADDVFHTFYGPLTIRLSKGVTTATIGASIETTRGV